MTKSPESFSAKGVISQLMTSDEYLAQPRGLTFVRALATTALEQTNYDPSQDSEVYHDSEALKKIVIGLLPDAYESQVELDTYRHKMHPSERGKHLRNTIEYNQALREMINNNPRAKMGDIMQFINEAATIMYQDPKDIQLVSEQSRARLDGMRHEVFAEEMFWRIPGVFKVRQATREEDMRGIDIVVEYEDGSTEGFDIKSTARAAQEANSKSGKPQAIWTGMNWEDFGSRLRIPPNEIDQYLPNFIQQVDGFRDQQRIVLSS